MIYHNGWGLPLFHDLDGARRRAVFLHADPAYHAADLPGFSGLVDAVLAITPAVQSAAARGLPELTGARTSAYRVPIEPPPILAPRRAGRPLTLGYAGRIERAQKRLDRLPEFLRALRATGQEFRFEMIGEGSHRRALEKELAGQVHFHGWVSREEYWRTLARWDGMVFFSENEGGPIALLEGMAAGVLPFYPARGGSWADRYAPQVEALCHYPPDDLAALARSVRQIFQRPAAQLDALREQGRTLVTAHQPEDYMAACLDLIRQTDSAPQISLSRRRVPRAGDWLPLGLVARAAPGVLRKG